MKMEQQEAWEQMKGITRDLAPIVWAYYGELMRLGFNEKQAFEIMMDLHHSLLNFSKRG